MERIRKDGGKRERRGRDWRWRRGGKDSEDSPRKMCHWVIVARN